MALRQKKLHRNHLKKVKKVGLDQNETVLPTVNPKETPATINTEFVEDEEEEFEQVEDLEVFINFLKEREARKTSTILTPFVIETAVADEDPLNQSMKVNKLSSADHRFP